MEPLQAVDNSQPNSKPPTPSPSSSSSSSSSASSSSAADDDDFFQLDPTKLAKSTTTVDSPPPPLNLACDSRDQGVENWVASHGLPPKSPRGGEAALLSTVSPTDLPPMGNPFMADSSYGITQSPPIQVMNKSDVPDPYRIPSSVFARSSQVAPMDWSVASNESLFSIHVGNNSFSRDHVFLMGKSGELSFPGPNDPFPPPPGNDVYPMDSLDLREHAQPEGSATSPESVKKGLRSGSSEDPAGTGTSSPVALHSSSVSRRSDGSAASIRSFAFPILTEGGRSGSVKVAESTQPVLHEQQEHQEAMQVHEQPLKPAPKARGKPHWCARWCFPCIYCFPCCCWD